MMIPTKCIYCDEVRTIERYEEPSGAVCINCANCCELRCLPSALENKETEIDHKFALLIMDAMYSDWYEFRDRTGTNLRSILKDYEDNYWHKTPLFSKVAGIFWMIAKMTQYRKAYWQNGEWHKF